MIAVKHCFLTELLDEILQTFNLFDQIMIPLRHCADEIISCVDLNH